MNEAIYVKGAKPIERALDLVTSLGRKFQLIVFLAVLYGMWDLSFSNRD